jgi:aminoglycoside N3'-acetyltransferase
MGREILLPAFNYDFTTTKRFNVDIDLPQVGRIPREAMSRPGWKRSLTPVYSILSSETKTAQYLEPFSENSIFADLVSNGGEIILFGVGCERLTFLHHVEHVFGVPYRYEKTFDGEVIEGKTSSSVTVKFHVRPHEVKVEYDFKRIEGYLRDIAAIRSTGDTMLTVAPKLTMEGLLSALEKDFSFLLTERSRVEVSEKLAQLGRPMTIEDFE